MDLTPFLRPLAHRRMRALARMDPAATQERTLLAHVHRAAGTQFGRDHDFAGIRAVADFQARVPIRDFDALWTDYWKAAWPNLVDVTWPGRIPFFARSSGTTTGITKHIPITQEIIKSNEQAGFDLLSAHLAANPASRPLLGRSFIVGGATALEQAAPGVSVGDVSGINTKLTPWWIRRRILPPPGLAGIYDWDEKLEAVSGHVFDQPVTMASGMCNWLLMMFDRIRERRIAAGLGDGPTFPHLQLMIHGGVPIDIYRDRLERHLTGGSTDLRELYPASEGFIGFADRGPGEGLRMMLDSGLFFEFVPLSEAGSPQPTRHWIGNVETDVDYSLVLSNSAGLWSYQIGDVVRLVDRRPPRLLIMGRVAQSLSPFGEHLIGAEIDKGVREAAAALDFGVAEYTVGPVMPSEDRASGHHVYIVEATEQPAGDPEALGRRTADHIDQVLQSLNFDYKRKRTGGAGLAPPRVRIVAPGAFEAWLRKKGKLGGQNKVPRITASDGRFAQMAAEMGLPLEPAEANTGPMARARGRPAGRKFALDGRRPRLG